MAEYEAVVAMIFQIDRTLFIADRKNGFVAHLYAICLFPLVYQHWEYAQ